MCDDCTQSAYEWGEVALEVAEQDIAILTKVLEEIADLHGGRLNAPENEHYPTGPYCPACSQEWPCVTFLTAVGAINDVR